MILLKTFLAALGLGVMPSMHNQAVHDTNNIRAAALAGHARMLRLQKAADLAAASGNTAAMERIVSKQSEVRSALDELARRLDPH